MAEKTLMFYINSIHRGGAERVLVQLAGRFAEAGYRAVLVTSYRDGGEYPVPEGVERLSIEEEKREQSRLKRNLSRIRALRALCKAYRPAALISFMAEPNFRAVLATRGLPVKTIVSVRNTPKKEYAGKLGGFVAKVILPMADGCVFQTEQARGCFAQRLQKKSEVIMNQVSAAFFDTEFHGARKDLATVGRLNGQKNQTMLIRAFSRIADLTEDTLRIYGQGELAGQLQELIGELGLEERVKLMGVSEKLPEELKGVKLFVLPSDYEGMPNALLEAMALGLPCIATDCPCGGPAAVIENGTNGILIPVGDEQTLAQEMERMLEAPESAQALGARAKESAERFRPERVFEQWREFTERVIAQEG